MLVIAVEHMRWLDSMREAAVDGYLCLDYLTAVDRIDRIDVIARVLNPMTGAGVEYCTSVGDGSLSSITSVFPAASWHERETAEMFGVKFVGMVDPRALLLRTPIGAPPLLRSTVLATRATTAWPGTAEPGGSPGRRRLLPHGVPEGWPAT
jgi:NADH-quinone oxidoreductase subunit C